MHGGLLFAERYAETNPECIGKLPADATTCICYCLVILRPARIDVVGNSRSKVEIAHHNNGFRSIDFGLEELHK